MKLLLTLLLIMPIISMSQVNQIKQNVEITKIENFKLKTGSLLKIEYIDAGKFVDGLTLSSIKIDAEGHVTIIKVTDMITKISMSGIQLWAVFQKKYPSCFLDVDEVDTFIKYGKLLPSILNENRGKEARFEFTSRSGLQVGVTQTVDKELYFITINKFDTDTQLPITKEDFQKLIELLVTAKTKL